VAPEIFTTDNIFENESHIFHFSQQLFLVSMTLTSVLGTDSLQASDTFKFKQIVL